MFQMDHYCKSFSQTYMSVTVLIGAKYYSDSLHTDQADDSDSESEIC